MLNSIIAAITITICCSLFDTVQAGQLPISSPNAFELLMQLPEATKFTSIMDLQIQEYLQNHSNFSVFVPVNNALQQKTDINLWYHILPQICLDSCWNSSLYKTSTSYIKLGRGLGEMRTVESGLRHTAKVLNSISIPLQQSVVYIIDQVLTVPVDIKTTLSTLHYTKAKDMVSLATDDSQTITLFAPSDEAFDTVDPKLLGADVNTLFFNTHVVSGLFYQWNSSDHRVIGKNLVGSNLSIIDNHQVAIDGNVSNITMQSIIADNGLIHVIDQVLWSLKWLADEEKKASIAFIASKPRWHIAAQLWLIIFVVLAK